MKLVPLPFETRVLTGASHKAIITFADLTAAALTQKIQIIPDLVPADIIGATPATNFGLAAGVQIKDVGWMLVTPFTGGAVATCVIDIGIGGTANKFVANATTDLFTALATNTKGTGRTTVSYVFTQADVITGTVCDLEVLFTTSVGNVNSCTAGLVEIYFLMNRLDQLPLVGEPG